MLEVWARLREFRRTPGYGIAVLFSLSAGMAVCVAVFSIVNTFVFGDLPGIADRTTLLRITWSDGRPLSPADVEPFESEPSPSLGPDAVEGDRNVGVVLPSGAAVVPAAFVSKDFFGALRSHTVLGALLTPADAEPGGPPVVMISDRLWQSEFGGEAGIIGHALIVGGSAFTIVGVLPQGFPGLMPDDAGTLESELPQIFLPMRFIAKWTGPVPPTARFLSVAVRLKDGAQLAAARQEVTAIQARVPKRTPVSGPPPSLRVFRMGLDLWDEPAESALVILLYLCVPFGILAIGCGNVVNLLLARAVEHASELSVRLALGASGPRIAWLLTMEILPLAIVAGILGWAGARGLLALAQAVVPMRFALDTRSALFAAAIVLLCTSAAGAVPGWLASRDVVAAGLRARQGMPGRTRIRQALVIAQVTFSVTLIAIAVLGTRSLQAHAPEVPNDARSTLVAELNLTDANPGNPRAALFVQTILDALAAEPTVRSAGFADFFLNGYPIPYREAAHPTDQSRTAFGGVVSPGWFDATHTRVLAGRTPAVGPQTFEAVVNAAFAARAGLNPTSVLGSRLRVRVLGRVETVAIVGVIADGQPEADGLPPPVLILPMSMTATPASSLVLTVRAADADAAKAAITRAVKQFDASIPFVHLDTLDTRLAEVSQAFEHVTMFTAAIAGIALLLASAGLYSLASYTVRRRTHELAIRMAMGAQPREILALVMRVSGVLVVIGGVLGLAVATPIAVLMRSEFFGLSPWSPWAGLPTIGLLLIVAGIATAVPAYHAIRIDPSVALREP